MRFTFDNKTYAIEFARSWGVVAGRTLTIEVDQDDPSDLDKTIRVAKEVPMPTRNPYTTVNLYEVSADGKTETLIRTAVVGAYHKEKAFTFESGRVAALTALLKGSYDMGQLNERGVPTDRNQACRPFRRALWDAYLNRPRPISVPKPKVEPEPEPAAV